MDERTTGRPRSTCWRSLCCGVGSGINFLWRTHHYAAPSPYGCSASEQEISDMANLTQVGLFIFACAFLSGLTLFLFRDQITSRRSNARLSAVPQRVGGKHTSRRF